MIKSPILLWLCLLNTGAMISQVSPVTHLSLKRQPTQIPADSLGNTWFYSVKLEAVDTIALASAVFHLKSTATGSVINQQTFILPVKDGSYQNGAFSSGIIKDRNTFFIALGNIKSLDPLKLVGDFIDSKNIHYDHIPVTE